MFVPLVLAFALSVSLPTVDGDDDYVVLAALSDKGTPQLVEREAREFLRKHPRHAKAEHARYRLACALCDLARHGEAAPLLRALAVRDDFEFAGEAAFRLGRLEADAGRCREAEAAFARALDVGREYLAAPARAARGEARLACGDLDGAREDLEAVVKTSKAHELVEACSTALAWCDLRGKKPREAAERARSALARGPSPERAAELSIVLGEASLDLKDARAALTAFAAARGGAFDEAARRGEGFAYLALDDAENAAAAFEGAVTAHPEGRATPECALQCGIARLRAKDPRGALAAFAHPRLEDGPTLASWRARAQAESGDREAGERTLARAIGATQDASERARLEEQRGALLVQLGRGDEAREALERSGSSSALARAAVESWNQKRVDEAERLALAVLEREPERADALRAASIVAEARFGRKEWRAAAEAFATCAQLAAEPRERARLELRRAWCELEQGDANAARKRAAAAAESVREGAEAEEARFLAAHAAERAGDSEAARRAFGAYLGAHGDGARAFDVARRLARLSQDDEAVDVLARVVRGRESEAAAAPVLSDLAERLSGARRFDEARAAYARVLELAPERTEEERARYGLAWCAWSGGDARAALAALDGLETKDPALVAHARELEHAAALSLGDVERAARATTSLVQADATGERAARAVRATSGAWREAKRFEEARAWLARVATSARTGPVRAACALESGWAALDAGDVTSAVRELERAQSLGAAGTDELAFFAGDALFAAQDDARAAELFARAAEGGDERLFDRALYKQGFALLRGGDPRGAEAAFARLVARAPRSALLHESLFLRGEALARAERHAEAIEPLQRVRAEAPKHAVAPKALLRLGQCLERTERWKEAADVLAELAQRHPRFEGRREGELARGIALARLGDERGARAALARAIEGGRDRIEARARLELGRMTLAGGDAEGALTELLRVAVLAGDAESAAEASLLAGDALEALGRSDRAAESWRSVVEEHAATPFAAQARARLERAPRKGTEKEETR